MTKYKIGEYTFNDEKTAKKAARELKAVEYIMNQLKDADNNTVLKLYNKITSEKMFSTQIGLDFVKQLKENLVSSGLLIEDADRKDVGDSSSDKAVKNESKEVSSEDTKKLTTEINRLKRINLILAILCLTLGLCVFGMFYVSSTINSPNILNYEEKLIDKYSTWEQELSEREDAIRTKERSLK